MFLLILFYKENYTFIELDKNTEITFKTTVHLLTLCYHKIILDF